MSFNVFYKTKRLLTAAWTIARRIDEARPSVKKISFCMNYRTCHVISNNEIESPSTEIQQFHNKNQNFTDQISDEEYQKLSIEERLHHFNCFIQTNPSNESVVHYYGKFGKDYDKIQDAGTLGSPFPCCAEVRSRFPDTTLRILDVCAGTGAIAKELREYGYSNIDGLDGSAPLLEIAKTTGVYTNLYHEFIGTEVLNSVQLESYDLLVCDGSIYPCHVEGRNLKAILSACKKGGYFVFTAYPVKDECSTKVTEIVREMANDGLIRVEKYEIIPHTWCDEESEQNFFVLKKL